MRPRADFYAQALPRSTDCLLVIEVSDTTPACAMRVKRPLYALHGVPAVWIVDLVHEQQHRHAEPAAGQYTVQQRLPTPAPAALALPGTAGGSASFEDVWSAQDNASPDVQGFFRASLTQAPPLRSPGVTPASTTPTPVSPC